MKRFWRVSVSVVVLSATLGGAWLVASEEMRTSRLQARLLSTVAKEMSFELREGPNPEARYPTQGPYNERFGYSGLPGYLGALTSDMYTIEMQAKASPRLDSFMANGGFPIYKEKTQAGLTLLDRSGETMFQARYPERVFARFEDVPPLVRDTLLFIENRELLNQDEPRRNPAVEWDRFAGALLTLPVQYIRPGTRSPGGSTLATQIEKYRHSPDGQTIGATEKLRQMASASVRAYLDGEDTSEHRKRILVDYLNSTPLTARPGFGEVNGLGDGLWAWYGTELSAAEKLLSQPVADEKAMRAKATVYKQVLCLLLAQRRPSYYLIQDRAALERLADSHLRVLASAGVIDGTLRDAALKVTLTYRDTPPAAQTASFVEQKAPNAIRAKLLSMMGVSSLYQLDRVDMTAESTLDAPTQARVVEVLGKLGDPAFAQQMGLTGDRLIDTKSTDMSKIIYSVTLYERGADANYLRIQADNLDQPLDINEGAKLDLGSTAKLRTLTTYLEIIAELHARYAHLPKDFLADVEAEASDNLTRWVAGWLMAGGDRSLTAMLDAAMERRYSASPAEAFFTGGGLHSFVNFNNKDNGSILTVTESLRSSVNLPFIRMMRDIVQFYMSEGGDDTGDILQNPDHPARQAYLARFADKEGSEFLNRFYTLYAKRSPDEALTLLASRSRPAAHRMAVIFRTVRPKAGVEEFAKFMRARLPDAKLDDKTVSGLYAKYGPGSFPLNDLGYLARIHPLELWLVAYLQENPGAKRREVLDASVGERQESYKWLFKKGLSAQNTRIRIGLEEEAFQRVTEAWRRLGYPFERLVPSFATAIGSSADRPAALAELMGIILNDGIRQPTVRVKKLHFAAGTPYEAVVGLGPLKGERVLRPEICATLRKALMDVAQNGTAKRVWGSFKDASGEIIPIGGKTGTGDHRLDRYGAGGRLIESRAVNRTATFAFYIGDRFFGTMTAFVQGPEADHYRFTSALPAQLLKSIAPALQPLINPAETRTADNTTKPQTGL
ncbi:transglycosylase domain-containing protein [Azospirillum sp. SYSU D00513]|uniref:transglycosylase domain-containing protein n=1 Tax=Azospirillum sp. SYSU D00513 TaxID=2812561 RepID=UPI001A976E73|nr:transglycosylase domain-containing protein [Azospirillum sp. SYSU D00513]